MLRQNVLTLENLTCQRGNKLLFSDLSLSWQSGDFVQIKGQNGIGKTSLLRIIVGLSHPLIGKVRWNNTNIFKNREEYYNNLLYLGHLSGIKSELTAWENLRFYQRITNCRSGDDILWESLANVGLIGREDIIANQLSAGQQKRISLARLWLSKAPLWILDEPFNAIDTNGVKMLTTLFEEHAKEGGIVILTSHQEVPSKLLQSVQLDHYINWENN